MSDDFTTVRQALIGREPTVLEWHSHAPLRALLALKERAERAEAQLRDAQAQFPGYWKQRAESAQERIGEYLYLIDTANERAEGLEAEIAELRARLAQIDALLPESVKRPPHPGPADPPEWETLREIAALIDDPVGRVTHGRHCPCSACKREDWTRPDLAPCGMHGPDCPGPGTEPTA